MIKLNINNFRSFLNTSFEFSKINILIGENSSGKSSLLKFILALKDSLQNPKQANLTFQGYNDLGNYKEVIYYNEENRNIEFSIEFDEDYDSFFFNSEISMSLIKKFENWQKNIEALILKEERYYTKLSYIITKNLKAHSEIKTSIENKYLGNLTITVPIEKKEETKSSNIISNPKCVLVYNRISDQKIYTFEDVSYEKKGFATFINSRDLILQFDLESEEGIIFYELAYLLMTQNFLENILERVTYINPIDSKPERFYQKRDTKSYYIKNDLEKFISLFSDPDISAEIKETILKKYNTIIQDFGIANKVELISNESLPIIQLNVKIKDLWSNITDIGYGVALQMPIIFELLIKLSAGKKILLIEQPEVHLYPKLQAKFIEMLVKYGGDGYYLIETHSEHIIRKLQIMVAHKQYDLNSESVIINYLTRGEKESTLVKHQILDNGNLNPKFPSGFFDLSYQLAKELF